MEVTLNPDLARWIEELLKSGRYGSVDEVVNTALYVLQDAVGGLPAEFAGLNSELERRLAALESFRSGDRRKPD